MIVERIEAVLSIGSLGSSFVGAAEQIFDHIAGLFPSLKQGVLHPDRILGCLLHLLRQALEANEVPTLYEGSSQDPGTSGAVWEAALADRPADAAAATLSCRNRDQKVMLYRDISFFPKGSHVAGPRLVIVSAPGEHCSLTVNFSENRELLQFDVTFTDGDTGNFHARQYLTALGGITLQHASGREWHVLTPGADGAQVKTSVVVCYKPRG